MRISDWSSDVFSSDLSHGSGYVRPSKSKIGTTKIHVLVHKGHHYEDSPPTQGVSNLDCSYSICFWQAAQKRPTTPSAAPNRWQIKLRNLVHLTTKLSRVEHLRATTKA